MMALCAHHLADWLAWGRYSPPKISVMNVDDVMPGFPAPDFPGEAPERDDRFAENFPSKRGRPKKAVNPGRLSQVLRMYFVEKHSMRQIADILGTSHMSIYRMLSDPSIELLI